MVLVVLGTPGLDFVGMQTYRSDSSRARAKAELGSPWAELAIAATDFNRDVRKPVYDLFAPIQPLIRARQSWHLYRNGPDRVRRVEILVDGEQVYLTGSADADWREAQFRYRRIRPPMETTAKKRAAANTWGMVRTIVGFAQEDFPEADEVVVRSLVGRWPGETLSEAHRWEARAPEWTVEPK